MATEHLRPRQRRARVVRRRRLGLCAVAALAAAAGLLTGSRAGSDDSGDDNGPTAIAPAAAACPPEVGASRRRLVGQMLVVRMEATASDGLRRAARRGAIGGVVLFPPAGTDTGELRAQIASLRAAARRGGAPAPLVAIDQEGGEVKRLAELPPDSGAPELGAEGPKAALAAGRDTGSALARLGIDVDLAPVLDLPTVPGAFIAARAFGDDPRAAGRAALAFAEGLRAGGVAATAKHFPGLGAAVANTDLGPSVISADRAALGPGLMPFRSAVAAGIDLVMVSNATYPALDAAAPASLSRRITSGLLRGRLGYRGVVITDDLGAGALAQSGFDEGRGAVAAAAAGADLLLLALSDGERAREALLRGLRSGALSRRRLIASCARVTALRERLGAGR